jgi:drug/metabolite transporter (DMT)-like permease
LKEGIRPSALRLYSLIIVMVSLWALNFVIARFALREFGGMLAASLRAILAGILLLPAYMWAGRNDPSGRYAKKDAPALFVLGVFGVALNQIFFLIGLERTSTAHASIMIGLTPILVLLCATAAGQERVTARKMIGMLIALGGVIALQLTRSRGPATVLGDIFVFLAAFTFSLFTVLGKRLTARYGGITVNTFAYVGGGALLIPFAVWHSARFDFSRVTPTAWASLLYMALFSSVICYSIFYYALRHIPASRVSAFSYLQPPLAMALGILILGDQFSGSLVAGGTLVLTGVYMTERG